MGYRKIGPLSGYKVIEISDYPVGCILGMLLADQGADVFKIQPACGYPVVGSPEFSVWNRGKTLIRLDDFCSDPLSIFNDHVRNSDIFIENTNPCNQIPFPKTYNELKDMFPKLICVSLPGFPKNHEFQHIPPDEYLVSAASGIYALNPSGELPIEGEGPSFHELYYSSSFAAITAAPAIIAAMLHRNIVGTGQQITVPVHDAMYQGMGTALVRHSGRNHGKQIGHPILKRFYQCKDKKWVNINFDSLRFLEPFLKFTGHSDWIDFFKDLDVSKINKDIEKHWFTKIDELWKTRTADDWEEQLSELGIPCTKCRTIDEWLMLSHPLEAGIVINVDDPIYGPMKQPGLLVSNLEHKIPTIASKQVE